MQALISVCNDHVKKYRTEEASVDVPFTLAHTLGTYMNLTEAPEEIIDRLHAYIDAVRGSDLSGMQIINTAELQ
jgi:hypothetical protein